MNYKKIVVAGGGVLGSQIAFQSAYCNYDVTIYLRSEESVNRAKDKITSLKDKYIASLDEMRDKISWSLGLAKADNFNYEDCLNRINEAYLNIKYETNLKEAFNQADLVIESVAEIKAEKIKFYKEIADILDEKTVLVTNSSTMLPSTFAKYTKRENKYLALHFANMIWKNNTAEVMCQEKTDKRYFEEVIKFSESINMIALPIYKEKSGYLLNSMLVPFLLSGLDLYANKVSDPETIDKAWTAGTGSPKGPFQIIDVVGLKTAYNIVKEYQKVPSLLNPLLSKMMMPYNYKEMEKILKKYIDEGKLGVETKEGFYKYE